MQQPIVLNCTTTASVCSKTSKQLLDQLWKHGYAYLRTPRLPQEFIQHVKRQGRLFHTPGCWKNGVGPMSMPELSAGNDSGFRGCYRYVGASGTADHIDCFSVGRETQRPWEELRGPYYAQRGLAKGDARLPSQALALNRWPTEEMLVACRQQRGGGGDNGGQDPLLDPTLFRALMLDYYDRCHATSMDVLRHLSDALGVIDSETRCPDLDFFTAKHQRMDSNLEMKFYPVFNATASGKKDDGNAQQGGVSGEMLDPWSNYELGSAGAAGGGAIDLEERLGTRLATHQDLSSVTLLAQDNIGGLEVLDSETDQFVAVPVVEDAIVVNAGVYLEKWTAGVVEATPHRVTKKSAGLSQGSSSSSSSSKTVGSSGGLHDEGRLSCVYFCFPDHDALITPMVEKGDEEQFLAGDLMPE